MNTKHTPGPWKFSMQSHVSQPVFNALFTGDNSALMNCQFAFLMHPSECHANAELIGKSPELFALAQRIANLNPSSHEIGPGMIAQLVSEARRLTEQN